MYNLIWDMDGTLIDSYNLIVNRIKQALYNLNLNYSYKQIHEELIRSSTFDFLIKVNQEHNDVSIGAILNEIKRIELDYSSVSLMPGVLDFLLKNKDNPNVRNFVYTHRDHKSTSFILENLKIDEYFIEVIDESSVEFARKPDTSTIDYLVKKYNMDKNNTFYIGDRKIDAECASGAGIKSIYYKSSDVDVDYFKHDFEITKIEEINSILF